MNQNEFEESVQNIISEEDGLLDTLFGIKLELKRIADALEEQNDKNR